MSPDRLWSFLWGKLLLLPAQMWRELNMNIWSRKPHTGMHAHAMTYVLTHSFYLERTKTVVSKGLRKGHPAVLSSLPPAPWGTKDMDPWNGLLFPSVNMFPSHTHIYIYITRLLCSCRAKLKELTWVWKIIKRGKVGDWSRGGGNWTLADEGRWKEKKNGTMVSGGRKKHKQYVKYSAEWVEGCHRG